MKRIISAALIVFLLTADALAAGIDSIIPDASLWGISRKELQKTANVKYTTMEIGKTKVLQRSGIEIDGILMDAYYVFDYFTWDSTGFTYNGLSKIVFLLADSEGLDSPALRDIRQQFIDTMTKYKGEPDSTAEAVSTWNMADCKIDIGIGTFKKYTGSKHKNVAIVFSGVEIPKPVTPPPTPKPTPLYTYIPKTPQPDDIAYGEKFTDRQMIDMIEAVAIDGIKMFTEGHETYMNQDLTGLIEDSISKGVMLVYDSGATEKGTLYLFDVPSHYGYVWNVDLNNIKYTFTILGPVMAAYLDYSDGDRIIVLLADLDQKVYMDKLEYSPIIDDLAHLNLFLRNHYHHNLEAFNDAIGYCFNN